MLSPYRVVDLTDQKGQLAGAMLAQLGAEVIAVEPPGGTSSRALLPRAAEGEEGERGLWHWAYNRGKKSVVLDLETESGAQQLASLVATVDIVLDSGVSGVDLASFRAANPGLITVSITPYGDDGPLVDRPATDLTVWAAAGPLVLAGDADRPPVRPTAPQAWLHAAGEAADAALVALFERSRSGRGQHVAVSAQLASMQATQSAILAYQIGGTSSTRTAGGGNFGDLVFRIVWPASDGQVTIAFLFGASLGPFTRRLMEWICEEGSCDAATRDKDWIDYGMLLQDGTESVEEYARVRDVVEAFTSSKTKQELLDAAVTRKLLIAPIWGIDEVAQSNQMEARQFWDEVPVGDRTIRFPGKFVKSDRVSLPTLDRAPRLGEHQSLLDDLPDALPTLVDDARSTGETALAGVKVLDFCWAVAGPLMTRVLADFGATVVRVESATALDVARTVGPFINDEATTENSSIYNSQNAGKLSLALDVNSPEGLAVIEDLVRWADVLTEAFAPGVMGRMGLSDERLRQLNPELIVMHSSIMGQTGPLASFAGIGTMGAAITGFYGLTGWPDRLPAGPFSAYTDYVAPRFGLAALLAALDHRTREGGGQILDFSQAEAATHFLTPTLLDYFVNGNAGTRAGNDDLLMTPHGVFPARGDDSWIAIACQSDADWTALAAVIGRPDLGGFSNAERRTRRDELAQIISAWSVQHEGLAAADQLAAAGVAASPVQNSREAAEDPQLQAMGHFTEVEHPTHGTTTVEGPRAVLSRTPGRVVFSGPPVGHHNFDVLEGVLGYDVDRIAEIAMAEALE